MNRVTKQERLQQNITFAENRLRAKIAALPQLNASDLDVDMKKRYMDGIEHEKHLIATWTKQLTEYS